MPCNSRRACSEEPMWHSFKRTIVNLKTDSKRSDAEHTPPLLHRHYPSTLSACPYSHKALSCTTKSVVRQTVKAAFSSDVASEGCGAHRSSSDFLLNRPNRLPANSGPNLYLFLSSRYSTDESSIIGTLSRRTSRRDSLHL